MTGQQAVDRARKCIGHGCRYKLGAGGILASREWPWNGTHSCDCTGFLAWAVGHGRELGEDEFPDFPGRWIESTMIVKDAGASGKQALFTQIPWELAVPGDVLAYGDHGTRSGHVGLVATVDATGPLTVVHCSAGNWRVHLDAIREEPPGPWQMNADSIAARCRLIENVVA